jgi:hypothetical protein
VTIPAKLSGVFRRATFRRLYVTTLAEFFNFVLSVFSAGDFSLDLCDHPSGIL